MGSKAWGVYDGASAGRPTKAWLPTTASARQPILIGWTDGAHRDLLRGAPASTFATTRTAWFGRITATGAVVTIHSAVMALDRTDRLPMTGPYSWTTVVLHELGHVMGLSRQLRAADVLGAQSSSEHPAVR